MSRHRYAVYPGYVRSKTDGDEHFIGAFSLMALYQVPTKECLIVHYEAQQAASRGDPFARQRLEYAATLIPLHPRYDGEYIKNGAPNVPQN